MNDPPRPAIHPRHAFRFRVLNVDGTQTHHTAVMSTVPTLNDLRRVVEPHLGGARMEHVVVLVANKPIDIFVDQLMHLKGLGRNVEATKLYRENYLQEHPRAKAEGIPFLAGPVVVFEDMIWP